LHEIEREPITRETLRRRYPSVEFILVSVPVKDKSQHGKIVWVDPRLDGKVLICDGGTVKVAIGKYKPPNESCDNIDASGLSLSDGLAALRASRLRVEDIALPESMPAEFRNDLRVRAQSPRFDQQPRVECSMPITVVAQPKTPRDSIVRRVVGDKAEFLDENGRSWKLCDSAASHTELGQCVPPPATSIVVSQWPAPGAWSERPGEIVVFTRPPGAWSTLLPNDEEPSMPSVPILAVPLAIAGYEVLRRLLQRNDPEGGAPPANTGTAREGIIVRGHIDRP
jgi:hypothetical protein